MDKRTAKALEASIAHWERNVAAETPEEVSISSRNCALCNMFKDGNYHSCDGCPVRNETGQSDCDGSPYDDAAECFMGWVDDPSSRSAWRAAAQRELDFLKSLRAEEK